MYLNLIACIDKNNGIGYNGDLLFHNEEDMKHFKKITLNSIVIMGRKTYESLPNKPLKDRINIVLTTDDNYKLNYPNAYVVNNIDQLMRLLKLLINSKNELNITEEIYVIGGESIYTLLYKYCNKAFITKVDKEYDNVDTYFPDISDWVYLTRQQELYDKKEKCKFYFDVYINSNPLFYSDNNL